MSFVKTKNEIVNGIFADLEKELKSLDKEKYLKWMKTLLDDIDFTGEETVVLDSKDKYLNEKFLNDYFKEKSVKIEISKNKENLGGGGFIVKKGNVEFSSSFDVLIDEIKDKFFSYIGKELFGEE